MNILFVVSKVYPKKSLKKFKKIHKNANFIFVKDNNEKAIIKNIHLADALINCPRKYFNNNLLSKAKKIKWVHTGGAGVDEYLFPEFVKSNIIFTNGRILQGPEIADHAIGLLLLISRNLHLHIKKINQKKIRRPIELYKKTCGIVGLGGIGLCVAERLKTFGMKIIGISEDLVPLVSFVDEQHRLNKMFDILPNLDVVICTVPLTKKTFKFFNYKFFKRMKKDSIFINVSRGKVVDTEILLKNKIFSKFRGIGLDVTDPEPLTKNHKLHKISNVVLTRHTAGLSDKNRERAVRLAEENISRFLKKEPLLNVVDKSKGY